MDKVTYKELYKYNKQNFLFPRERKHIWSSERIVFSQNNVELEIPIVYNSGERLLGYEGKIQISLPYLVIESNKQLEIKAFCNVKRLPITNIVTLVFLDSTKNFKEINLEIKGLKIYGFLPQNLVEEINKLNSFLNSLGKLEFLSIKINTNFELLVEAKSRNIDFENFENLNIKGISYFKLRLNENNIDFKFEPNRPLILFPINIKELLQFKNQLTTIEIYTSNPDEFHIRGGINEYEFKIKFLSKFEPEDIIPALTKISNILHHQKSIRNVIDALRSIARVENLESKEVESFQQKIDFLKEEIKALNTKIQLLNL